MIKFILLLLLVLCQQAESQSIIGKFVAFDKYALWSHRQLLLVEVQDNRAFTKGTLLRVWFLLPPKIARKPDQRFMDEELFFKNNWKLTIRDPNNEEEKSLCKESKNENFFRTEDNLISADENDEPELRFRSTQYDADIKFDNLSKMPCMVLENRPQPLVKKK